MFGLVILQRRYGQSYPKKPKVVSHRDADNMKLTFFVFALAVNGSLGAQVVRRVPLADSSVAAIMRRGGNDADALIAKILRQSVGQYSRAKLDELADSVAERAIANRAPPSDTSRFGPALRAVNGLGIAGSVSAVPGQSYPGALDRLIRVHREAHVEYMRIRALFFIPAMQDRTRALAYLRDVATSQDRTAEYAVRTLVRDLHGGVFGAMPPTPEQQRETIAILTTLSNGRQARDSSAAKALEEWRQARSPR
jgi:hypothetical protein